jgi:integrase
MKQISKKRAKLLIASRYEIPRSKKKLYCAEFIGDFSGREVVLELGKLEAQNDAVFGVFGAGLRVRDVVNLRVRDIHSERMVINIKGAKGKKDRTAALSEEILELLRRYLQRLQANLLAF